MNKNINNHQESISMDWKKYSPGFKKCYTTSKNVHRVKKYFLE
jgi:hypothetical protein